MFSKKIRILLDPQIFSQHYGGISRLFVEIYLRLKDNNSLNVDFPLIYSTNEYLKHYNLRPSLLSILFCNKYFQKGLRKIFTHNDLLKLNILYAKFNLKIKKYDLILVTYFDSYYLNYLDKKTRILVTVYDLIQENYLSNEKDVSDLINAKKILYKNTSHFISISNSTKRDLLSSYTFIPASKVSVVYLASNCIQTNSQYFSNTISKPYILFVGYRSSYKNFIWFVKNVSSWLKQNDTILLCCGGGGFNSNELMIFDDLNISSLVIHLNASDNNLPFIYKNSFAFIYPTKYEGFGIPILEAMSNGCPVLINNNSSLYEVGSDAALYFNYNDNSLLINLEKLKESDFRKTVIKNGFLQSSKFSWDKCASDYFNIISSLVYK